MSRVALSVKLPDGQALDYVYYFLRIAEDDDKKVHDDVGTVKIADFIGLAQQVRESNSRFVSSPCMLFLFYA